MSDPTRLNERVDELRAGLQGSDPLALAARIGGSYTAKDANTGEFRLLLWGEEITVTFPDLIAFDSPGETELPNHQQALLLYHFTTSDGAPLTGRWISFAELPAGRFYNQAYQGYTGRELARALEDNLSAFERAAQSLGGKWQPLGHSAYSFQALPRVSLLAICWLGDEDFPSTCQVLFDASASHHLPTDVCAILGSTLTRRLIRAITRNEADPDEGEPAADNRPNGLTFLEE